MRKRGKLLLGTEPQSDWYVFPHAEGKGKPEPIKPMTGWRSAWRSMTRAIHCPACDLLQQPADVCANEQCKADINKVKSPLHGLRFHDLRHHAITELSEGQASDQTIMSIAGHISPRMLRLYSRSDGGETTGARRSVNEANDYQWWGYRPQLWHKARHKIARANVIRTASD
jgi:hypothetical protein